MCGITGVVGPEAAASIDAMTDALTHRGPDSQGTWHHDGIALGARRLAIVDVRGGRQPMVAGAHVLVANGEIYNYRSLRTELESLGDSFSTQCDVEVILHGVRRFGTAFLERLRGFFAFALWDGDEETLLLARDRFGIAPLVWTTIGAHFVFASEVKAFERVDGWEARLNHAALGDYLTHRYVLGPETLFEGVQHVPHGHWMMRKADGSMQTQRWHRYPRAGKDTLSLVEATERLEEALERAVARRRQGEVPVGLYLSGGLDSSLIAAISAAQGEALPAFSHGFDPTADETSAAREVAEHLGMALTRANITPDSLLELPKIVRAMEQPVANSDVVGLWQLAHHASQDVTVVLCGEGADELFGSYPHQQLLAVLEAVPRPALQAGRQLLGATPSWLLNRLSSYPGAGEDGGVRDRLKSVLAERSLSARYTKLVCLFDERERSRLLGPKNTLAFEGRTSLVNELDKEEGVALERLVPMKFESWLPDYHLGRENRIAMAHGLEARYPFLDVDVVNAVAGLPLGYKTGWLPPREKRLLRRIARQHLPKAIAQRPKGPVRVPLALFGEHFHAMLGDLLNGSSARTAGLLESSEIEAMLSQVRAGSFLASRQAFALLMFEIWLREWKVSCR